MTDYHFVRSDMGLDCEIHGPMIFRFARDRWECAGFDGEGCASGPISAEAADRLFAGETYWPWVRVIAAGREA